MSVFAPYMRWIVTNKLQHGFEYMMTWCEVELDLQKIVKALSSSNAKAKLKSPVRLPAKEVQLIDYSG